MNTPRILSLASLLVLLAAPVSAQPPNGPPPDGSRRGPPHGPPPAAFEACADQDDGSLCAFETPRGGLEGTCRRPRGERLVCVPHDHPAPPRGEGGSGYTPR